MPKHKEKSRSPFALAAVFAFYILLLPSGIVILGGAGMLSAMKFFHKPVVITSDEVEDARLAKVAADKTHDEQRKKLEAMQVVSVIGNGTWCAPTSAYVDTDGNLHGGSNNCHKSKRISTDKKESITPRGYLEQQINEKAAGEQEDRAFETYYELRGKYFKQEVDRRCDCKEKNDE